MQICVWQEGEISAEEAYSISLLYIPSETKD